MPATPQPPPAGARLLVDLTELPPSGSDVEGELPADVFALEKGGPRPASPLHYKLHLNRQDDHLTATGTLSADFSFDCVRCLEPFTDRISLHHYFLEVDPAGKTPSVDLTDALREDILLALPDHPRCEEASLNPRVCPAAEMFPAAGQHPLDSPEITSTRSDSQSLWGALDQLDLQPPTHPLGKPRRNR